MQDVSPCFMTFFMTWKDRISYIQIMRAIYGVYIVFLPIINKHLTNWKNAWVYHPMRTERNKSPMQLWIRGLQEAWGSQSLEDEVFQVLYEANRPFYRYSSYIELI